MHSLGWNHLKDEGTIAVCNALKGSKVSKLKELSLRSNDIKVAGAASVAAYLAVTASLTKMDLRLNSLGDAGKDALQNAVKGRSGFKLDGCPPLS